jgi:DNA polymerase eta
LVAAAADKLWKEVVGTDDSKPMKVTSIYLTFSGIQTADPGQQGIEGFFKPPSKRKRESGAKEDGADETTYVCPRCKRELSLPANAPEGTDLKLVHAKVKQEHDDYHFAQDLAKGSVQRPTPKSEAPPTKKSKKGTSSKSTKEGIARFFTKPSSKQ